MKSSLKACARIGVVAVLVLIGWSCLGSRTVSVEATEATGKVRQAGVAGLFYPADPVQLGKQLDGSFARVTLPESAGDVVALVSPHAGYQYSGDVAAHAYSTLKGRRFKRVVVVGPTHLVGFSYSSVYDGSVYSTPLGRISVDQEFARRLAKKAPSIRLSGTGHDFEAGTRGEHSVETQLPFLQRVLGEFVLVPVVMGDPSYEASRALGVALADLLKNDPDTLLVASSDLSHFHDYATASRMDGHLLKSATDGDFYSISKNNALGVWEACGGAPIVAIMIAAERLGAAPPRLLKYANSGDVTGEKSRVVGYGALVMNRRSTASPKDAAGSFDLDASEKAELLRLARTSVETAVRDHKRHGPPVPASPKLTEERGAFVTLKKAGDLRGCIGYVSAMSPLYSTVSETAAHAALRDPRFPPVRSSELSELNYEVSVLSPYRHVLDPATVQVGRDGLLIQKGNKSGLLLPQVAVEQHWDRTTFLDEACLKAGLPPKAWQDPDTDIFAFTAVVFGDEEAEKKQER